MANKKVFTDESLATLVSETKTYVDSAVSTKANSNHTHDDRYYTESEINTKVSNLQSGIDSKVTKESGKGLSTNDYTTTEKTKLAGIASGAQVNQNAFSNVTVGSTTIAADSTTDTLTVAAGTGISVSADATNDKITITNSGVRSIGTGSANGTISVNTNGASANIAVKGLGSAAYTASTAYDAAGTAQTKADAALASAKSYADTKVANLINGAPTTLDTLKEIADAMAANDTVVDALESAVGNKVDKVSGKGLSTNDYTTTEKNKLAGIASGAEVNQNAFSNVTVGSTTIAADGKTDTLTIASGGNITITPDASADKVTFTVADGSTSAKGVVKLTDSTSSTSTTTAATPNSVKSAYDLANTAKTTADGKAPTSHASTGTSYGIGTSSNYGHVKLSDATNSTSAASAGIAASPAAVKAAYDLANGRVPSTRKVNGKALSADITLSASDVGALPISGGTLNGALTVLGRINSGNTSTNGGIDIYHDTPYLDFHCGKSSSDYTTRIIEKESGKLTIQATNVITSGNIYTGASTDDTYHTIYVRNKYGSGGIHVSTASNVGLMNNGISTWIIRMPSDGVCRIAEKLVLADNFHTEKTNQMTLGTPSYKWKQLYAATATINTSDRNDKKDFRTFDSNENYEKFFMDLKPMVFKFKNGESGRDHFGFVSQDVEESLHKYGFDDKSFAGFCKDAIIEEIEGEDGITREVPKLDEDGNEQYVYGLRYSEFTAMNTHMIQKVVKENQELKTKNEELETRLLAIEKMIEELKG